MERERRNNHRTSLDKERSKRRGIKGERNKERFTDRESIDSSFAKLKHLEFFCTMTIIK